MTIERDNFKPMKITGAWLTQYIRAGKVAHDLCTLTKAQEAMIRDGHAEIRGDSETGLSVYVPCLDLSNPINWPSND